LKRKIYNAIIDGNVEQLNSLIKKEKVDVNALSTKKITILNFAIKQKKLEIIKFLVKARAKVDQI
jgi:predicted transcriptional regulator